MYSSDVGGGVKGLGGRVRLGGKSGRRVRCSGSECCWCKSWGGMMCLSRAGKGGRGACEGGSVWQHHSRTMGSWRFKGSLLG